MANNKRYPLSTADGNYIPLEVERPNSYVRTPFLLTPGTTSAQVPSGVEILKIKSTANAIIQFFASATLATSIVDNTAKIDTSFLPLGETVYISPPTDKPYYSIIGDTTGGIAHIQLLESWNGLALQSQVTRK